MSGLRIQEDDDSVTFEVRVAPRARRNAIIGIHEGKLKVALTAPPVEGAANDALRKLLAKTLGVPKSNVTIVRGERVRNKLLRIRGVGPEALCF
ncbi:MAG: DUF167 domain-containing protein [Myxococcales bacterium]|nr:DUF167 domain-containing protein [Myxococcales bacterium]MDH3484120.1 DUF167 domain-containing protein [Myxococcales bacterium]